jgi:hypothetical protein
MLNVEGNNVNEVESKTPEVWRIQHACLQLAASDIT